MDSFLLIVVSKDKRCDDKHLLDRTKLIDWRWFGQTLNPYYEHDQSTSTMLIDDDRLIFHTIDDDHWDFGADNSGNLIDQRNIEHYISRFQTMKIDLVRRKKNETLFPISSSRLSSLI